MLVILLKCDFLRFTGNTWANAIETFCSVWLLIIRTNELLNLSHNSDLNYNSAQTLTEYIFLVLP